MPATSQRDEFWMTENYLRTLKRVGSQASCHQRIALTCDDAQAETTLILSFVSLSYRLLAVDEDDLTPPSEYGDQTLWTNQVLVSANPALVRVRKVAP